MEKTFIEQDVLNAIAGSYHPGFMQIELTYPFGDGFKDFTPRQLGTFFHEYIHFLQNISTPWGLFMSMTQYQTMVETYKHIQETDDVIELPLIIDFQNLRRRRAIVKVGSGFYPFGDAEENLCHKIDTSKKIGIHRTPVDCLGKQIPKICLEIHFTDGTSRNIDLGAIIINESMAAMYQMLIDSSATHENNDLPYNLVRILWEQLYPDIPVDIKKLIAVCYISLFSMSPAEVLFDQMYYASEHPEKTVVDLFNDFIKSSRIVDNKGGELDVCTFTDNLINIFKNVLSKSLQIDLDYIEYVLESVRISSYGCPLLSLLLNDEVTKEMFEDLVNILGLPFTYNHLGQCYLPKSIKEPEKDSEDMLRLIQNWTLYNHMVSPNKYYCCPLRMLCLKSNPPVVKDECFDYPWEGSKCPITPLTDYIGFGGKSFKWNYPSE